MFEFLPCRLSKMSIGIMLFAFLFVNSPHSSAEEYQFQSLFNGKDLTGWVVMGNPAAFLVKNECIFSTGASPYPVWLRTEKEYENFILRFEYKTAGWFEGGILFHAPLYGPASRIGMKLHIRHDRHEFGLRSPGAIYDVAAPNEIVNLPSGQWNHCEVICKWPNLQIKMNDTIIHDIDMSRDEQLQYRLRRGYIGIQGIGCQAYYRNIEICELPDQEEWETVFPDSLDGFTYEGESDWTLEDNILTAEGKLGHAITKQVFEEPFELHVWAKTIVNGNGGVLCRWNENSRGFEVQVFNTPDSTNPTGSIYGIAPASRVVSQDEEWFLIQILAKGPSVTVFVNGEKVSEYNQFDPPFKGHIAFQQHTPNAKIQFRDARIKKIVY